MARTTQSVPFSLSEQDIADVERLAALYTDNNKSELIRLSVRRLAAADRAEQLASLREASSGARPTLMMGSDAVRSLVSQVADGIAVEGLMTETAH